MAGGRLLNVRSNDADLTESAGDPRKGGTVLIAPGHAPTVIIDTDGGPLIEHL